MKNLDKNTLLPTVSIVIPVYNEADTIAACLEAIAAQSVQPKEVIIVDNNSTDGTSQIVRRYPFVKLLHEPNQGVVYARATGFDAARGDIIGRIDADTMLPADWVACLQEIFADQTVHATSGRADYTEIVLERPLSKFELVFRRWLARRMRSSLFLYGANMALRRSAWQAVKSELCNDIHIHEDLDLAIHLGNALPGGITYDERLRATISARRLSSGFYSIAQYAMANPATYARHGKRAGLYMYPVAFLAIVLYWPLGILRQLYDPISGKAKFTRLFVDPETKRVNPATFRD